MAKAALVARILLGLVFTVFGLNFFFGFFEMPPPEPQAAQDFMGGLIGSGYFFNFLKITESVCGILLLSGFFVPLALTVLAPVILNITFFHVFLDPSGLPLAIVLVALEVFLAYAYRGHFSGVLARRATVGG